VAVPAPAPAPEPPTPTTVLDIRSIYVEHGPFIGRTIQRLVGDGAHVDDLLQETFIVAFRKRAAFDGRAAVRTWLYGIASNLCMRHRRGAQRFAFFRGRLANETTHGADEVPDRRLERQQDIAMVHEVLGRLPFKQRELFVLYELEGLEGPAIAELLGIPLGTVWTRLREARIGFAAAMRKRLAQERTP
jgi:RNA polymerase sigma-70 factor (ECF subfamily)